MFNRTLKHYTKYAIGFFAVLCLFVILIASGYGVYKSYGIKGAVCTQEAKLCPDGSYVGRTGPRCEFAECPNAKIKEQGIEGCLPDSSAFKPESKARRDARRIADIRQLQIALELYFNKNALYPQNLDLLTPSFSSIIPSDPTTNLSYHYEKIGDDDFYLYATFECNSPEILRNDYNAGNMLYEVTGRRGNTTPDTSTWRTYRNEKYAFELKYPENWQLRDSISPDADPKLLAHLSIGPMEAMDLVEVSLLSKGDIEEIKQSIIESYEGYGDTDPDWEISISRGKTMLGDREVDVIRINGYIILSAPEGDGYVSYNDRWILATYNSDVFIVGITINDEDLNIYQEDFDQVLTTFKFIE